jgi:glycine cleavage system regulatory protein
LKTSFVLTVIGADKPGLVEALSKAIAAYDANWEESRMAHLGGQFAGILRITVDEANREALLGDLEGLERSGLRVVAADSGAPAPEPETKLLRLELVSDDRAGIIRDISQALAKLGVNVEELSSEITSAPMAGGNLFRMQASLRAPEGVPLDRVTAELEGLADELMVDLSFADLKGE